MPHDTPTKGPIFIVGMPRSGTTLMMRILSMHPEIAITIETHFLSIILPLSGDIDWSKKKDRDRFWDIFIQTRWFKRLKLDPVRLRTLAEEHSPVAPAHIFTCIMHEFARAHGKPRWGEKTPNHYRYIATLLEWYPDAKILFMVRDPRAVLRSVRGSPWGNRSVWFQGTQWQKSIDILRQYTNSPHVLPVQYESLVSHPEEEIRRICAFIGETFSPAMLAPQNYRPTASIFHYPPGTFSTHNQRMLKEPITISRRMQWQRDLSTRMIAAMEYMCRDGMRSFGYQTVTGNCRGVPRFYLLSSKLSAWCTIRPKMHFLWYQRAIALRWVRTRFRSAAKD